MRVQESKLSISKEKSLRFNNLQKVLGKSLLQKIEKTNILIVGAGGLGCQLIKNLSKFKINKVTVIDLDIIQETNLNRQFYFSYSDIGKSKSEVLKDKILKINPSLNIETCEDTIYNAKFNYQFYNQFDIVFSALDSMKARQFLAKNVTKYSKVLIDAGTSGYNGQCYPTIRYLTSCHNCYRQNIQVQYAICSIRARPEKTMHCAVYAKTLYQIFFAQINETKYLQTAAIQNIRRQIMKIQQNKLDELQNQIINFFNHIFFDNIKTQDMEGNNISYCRKLSYEQAIKIDNYPNHAINIEPQKYVQIFDKILSLSEYAQLFVSSFKNLLYKKRNSTICQKFDKDKDQCCIFATCVTNLRIYNFKNTKNDNSKLKYLTFFQCKELIGKIIPAIASTNSIAASLQVNQFINVISQNFSKCRYTTINYYSQNKIQSHFLSLPNIQCEVCSQNNFYFQIQCNFSQVTFGEFEQFANLNCHSNNRSIYCGPLIIVKNQQGCQKISPNKAKLLNFKQDLVIQNSLTLNFLPDPKISIFMVQIILINKENNIAKFTIVKAPKQNIIKKQQK